MQKKHLIIGGAILVIALAIYGLTGQPKSSQSNQIFPVPSTTNNQLQTTFVPQEEIVPETQENYSITYDPNYNMYIISVLNTPFDKIRVQAEQALLKKVGLSPEEACDKIKVQIGTPNYVDPNQTQIYDTFSFCPK